MKRVRPPKKPPMRPTTIESHRAWRAGTDSFGWRRLTSEKPATVMPTMTCSVCESMPTSVLAPSHVPATTATIIGQNLRSAMRK
jgi:hypothetical protein